MKIRAYDWIAHHAVRSPARLAMVDLESERRFGYAELDERVDRAAGLLAGLGVGAGDRVAVLAPNSSDVFELQFACWRLGALLLPLNWRLAPPELQFICDDAAPQALVFDSEMAEAAARLDVPRRLCRGGPSSEYELALAVSGPPPCRAEPDLEDACALLYTSGTTGSPKGAVITHAMNLFNAVNMAMPARLTADSTCLTVLPTFHTSGLNLLANPVFHLGGTVLVARTFDAGQALRLMSDPAWGISHFFGVPANYLFMCQHPDFARADLSRLVYAGLGGAPAPISLLETYAARGCALTNGYGMTETGPTVFLQDATTAGEKFGSVGLPVLHVEVRIVTESGAEAAPGAVGELWVRGPGITPGYWNRPEATDESFTGGWLRTGDAARRDEDGWYYVVDRWKDMYISGGENVYPAEVENAIYALEDVAEAAVIGVADERWGEVGLAVIVLKAGGSLTEDRVVAHCRERLARYKVPRRTVFCNEPLPRNASGKVLKRELRERYG